MPPDIDYLNCVVVGSAFLQSMAKSHKTPPTLFNRNDAREWAGARNISNQIVSIQP